MDVFNLLSYINKISLFAFFVTTLVVGYQVYILKKEKAKEKAPAIPDFKENINLGGVANFTSLPSSLTKVESKAANYSKTIFFTISLLTVIIIIFVVSLINKKSSAPDQALVPTPAVISSIPTRAPISPTMKVVLSPTLMATTSALLVSPTIIVASPSPTLQTLTETPTVSPTEIIVAKNVTVIPTSASNAPTVLPETGSLQKGLLIIGVAISTIFFSFWF